MNNSKTIAVIIALLTGLVGGFLLAKIAPKEMSGDQTTEPATREILYWKAPMDPDFRRDGPGQSPMGMDLVPVYANEGGDMDQRNLVRINPAVQNNIGVRTAIVQRTSLVRSIETVGFVQMNQDKSASIDVRTEGWIEKLYVKSVGETVAKGQPLFDLYSKPLVTAQEEFLQTKNIGRDNLILAAKARLQALGLSTRQIEKIAKSGKVRRLSRIYAPQDGVITILEASEGAFVTPGSKIMMLADLSSVWVVAEVFETQANWVKIGQRVRMQISAEPGRIWNGQVDYMYPMVNPTSRTVQVRLRFDNADGALRPKGYARLNIETTPALGVLAIDRQAVIQTGSSSRVILALGEGKFQPANVKTGLEVGGKVEIITGLNEGEEVVISSQFLLDSESSLRGTELRMTAPMDDGFER